ncbi:MAG: radical SAM family heme chaperone HemW [Polyangiales bacterium]
MPSGPAASADATTGPNDAANGAPLDDASVYVHFPWCIKKCPYCDFVTRKIEPDAIPHDAYADAVLAELEARRASVAGKRLVSVFFGGGTPSLWSPAAIARVLSGIRAAFDRTRGDLEVTAECNPSSLDEGRAAAFAEAGINRLSVGVQSLQDRHLTFLGRAHDREGALRALRGARKHHARLSADLMFGMPTQRTDELLEDVRALIDLGVEHLSAYALTIEPGTQFGELHRKGRLAVAPDEAFAAMFTEAESLLAALGFDHYEVSNYAQPGAASRHNLHYWRTGSYVGLGAAAVGCIRERGHGRRWKNLTDAEAYMRTTGLPELETEELDAEATAREALMLGLRLAEGLAYADVEAITGRDIRAGREGRIARKLERGELATDGARLRVPRERWLLLDGIVADLF